MIPKICELLSREEIREVILRYSRGVDRCDAGLVESCYHPQAIDDHGEFIGSPSAFAARVAGERARRYASTTHLLAEPAIEFQAEHAKVTTSGVAHHVTVPDDAGQQFVKVMAIR